MTGGTKEIRRTLAPAVVVIAALLMALLYVGGYLALVIPNGKVVPVVTQMGSTSITEFVVQHYRIGGQWPSKVFWPLEQIDRKLRPVAWDSSMTAPRMPEGVIRVVPAPNRK
jgi:hypothetical protein